MLVAQWFKAASKVMVAAVDVKSKVAAAKKL